MAYDPLKAAGPGTGLDHPPSYWAATAGPAPDDDGALDGDRETEVAIIGGGYTGLSCAAYLARKYRTRPVVLEANRTAWGCSGRNGSFVRPALGRLKYFEWVEKWGAARARALFAEALSAVQTVRDLIADGAIDCDKQPEGWLKIAHRPSRAAELEKDCAALRDVFGHPAELLDAAAIAANHFRGEEAFCAMRVGCAFALHPLKLAHGVLRMARAAGAVVHGGSPVTGWRRETGGHVLQTPGGRVSAKQVVIATNGYTPERLFAPLKNRLLPVLSNIVVTRPMTAEEKEACRFVTTDCMYDTRNLLNYFRRLPDDRIMLGGRGPITDNPARLAVHRERLLANIKRKFPALRDITAEYFWGGWVAVTRDQMPRIGHADDDRTVHFGLGYSGSGVAASLYAGRRLAERLGGAGGETFAYLETPLPRIPLAAFRRLAQRALYVWFRYRDERD